MPDSCGKDEAAFDVKDQMGQPPPAAPEEGKAQIIFIAKVDRGDGWPEVRFGMDGTWSGATKDNSYFAVSVTPGEHHICAAKQSGHFRSDPAMVTLTAEAGKVYYYEFKIFDTNTGGSSGGFVGGKPVTGGGRAPAWNSSFGDVSPDEGKYRMKVSPLSVFTPKKK